LARAHLSTYATFQEAQQLRKDLPPQEQAADDIFLRKVRIAATHFPMKRLPRVATEIALHVLAYNSHARHEHRRHPTANDNGWIEGRGPHRGSCLTRQGDSGGADL
jgi:hypothetical protein